VIERFLFRKIEVWVVLLLILLGLAGTMAFGVLVRTSALGGTYWGALGTLAFNIASIPHDFKNSLDDFITQHKVFRLGTTDFLFSKQLADAPFSRDLKVVDKGFDETGYLLVSGFRPENGISSVYLYSLKKNKVLHTWVPPIEEIHRRTPEFTREVNSRALYRAQHPYLMKNGDVIFGSGEGPLARVGVCGDLKWVVNRHFHHSLHMDHEGNLVAVHVNEKNERNATYRDDGFAIIDPGDGRIIREYSLVDILNSNGYSGLVFGTGVLEYDRIHLNDAEPILVADQHVQVGDVMLSSRHLSTVLLFRPATNKVVWLKTGPWLNQHDIDYPGNGIFSIFGNNNIRFPNEEANVKTSEEGAKGWAFGGSKIFLYKPTTGEVATLFDRQLGEVRNPTEGLQRILPNGDLWIEQTNDHVIRRIGPNGERWVFINYVGQGKLGALHWSRYITAEEANFPWLEKLNCATSQKTE